MSASTAPNPTVAATSTTTAPADPLLRLLHATLPAGATVVMIGAGDGGLLDDLAALGARRLVLFEGDARRAARLQARAAGRAGVEVIAQALAAAGGPLTWRRFNLESLCGPLDAAGLRAVYPRLEELERGSLPAQDVRSALAALDLAVPGAATALVLDVPGQAAGLLAALGAERLHAFDVVALRECARPLGDDEAGIDTARAALAAAGYASGREDAHGQPLWPSQVFRFDRAAHERRQLAAERDEARAQLAALREETETRVATHEQALSAAQQRHQATLDSRRAEHEAALVALQQSHAAALAAARHQLEAQTAALQAAERAAATLRADHEAARADLQRQHAAAVEALNQQLAAQTQARTAAEQQAATLNGQLQARTRERDDQQRNARQAQDRITQLETELAELGVRHGLLKEELIRAESQIELISDLLLRQPQS